MKEQKKNTVLHEIEGRKIQYRYECIQCGNCCRAGFEIVIHKEDAERWITNKKIDYCKHVMIDPKCISLTGLAGFHIEEVNTLERIKKKYGEEQFEQKTAELVEFIKETHEYLGEGIIPLPIYTIIPGMERRPILVPKSFITMRDGWRWGLIYIIRFENSGDCPFLIDNLCSIHAIKPNECKAFPYDKDGKLTVDNYRLKICKGFKRVEKDE